jgi:hypothetical protein
MRVVTGVAVVALGLVAVVVSGNLGAISGSLATLGQGQAAEGTEGAYESAEAVRRNAAAEAAFAKQISVNAKTAAETADSVYAAAQAEAEKLNRLASQATRSYELASVEDRDAGDAATMGTQETEDDALGEDATLVAVTATYTAAREEYQASTDALVVLSLARSEASASAEAANVARAATSETADAAKSQADAAHITAAKANLDAQLAKEVGEEKPGAAIARAEGVARASAGAKAAEIAAGKAGRSLSDSVANFEGAKLLLKTATESFDIEQARNAELARVSTETEARMIDQSDRAAKAKTAAAHRVATSVGLYLDASVMKAEMKDKADKALEAAATATAVAKTRAEESKAATSMARARSDAYDVSAAELVLAERTVEVETMKMRAVRNAKSAAAAAKAETQGVETETR